MTIVNNILKIITKSKNKRVLATVLIGGLSIHTATAQSPWSADVGAQFSITKIKSDGALATHKSGTGGALNLGLGYALNDTWSLHSGLGIGYLNNNTRLSNYSGVQNATDIEGEAFEFRYTVNGYFEDQRYTVASVPLAFQYETAGVTRFYARAGASYNIFVNSDVEASAGSLSTTGYFESTNAELDRPRFAGFGNFTNQKFAVQDLDLNSTIRANLEVGIKQKVATNQWVYVGLFFEAGLTSIASNNNEGLVAYNRESPTDFIVNSSLVAVDTNTGSPFLNDPKIQSFGFKFWYSFNF